MAATSAPLRPFDTLDLLVVESMCLSAFGPDSQLTVRRGDDGSITVGLSAAARDAVAEIAESPAPSAELWVELASPALVEAVVDRVGECWRAEAEVGVELALALGADAAVELAIAAAAGPVTVPAGPDAADLIAADVPNPGFIYLI